MTPSGVRGVASLGTAEYQDEYVKTPQGWRYKQRVHVYPPQIPGSYSGKANAETAPKAEAPSTAR